MISINRNRVLVFLLFWTMLCQGQLYINEFQVSNINTAMDPKGNYLEWIELYNAGDETIDLTGYHLTNNLGDPSLCRINYGSIGANKYGVIWLEEDGYRLSAEVNLDMDGGVIGLYSPQGQLADSVTYFQQFMDISYGRRVDGAAGWAYFGEPSPYSINFSGATNDTTLTEEVRFSLSGGFYEGTQTVALSAGEYNGGIRFTLDGSWPTSSSMVYETPLQFSETTIIRARLYRDNQLPGEVVTNTYMIDENHDLPVVSIVTNPDNFFGDDEGLYVIGENGVAGYCLDNPVNWNQDWERPVNFEYFTKEGAQEVNQLVGSKIFGGCSRMFRYKSLAIIARNKYGHNSLDYKFFDTKEADDFKSIVLRNSGNDAYGSMFRDGFMQNLLHGRMDVDLQGYQPAIVFINGEYWGIQNIREKINEHYPASNYDLDSEGIDMLEKLNFLKFGEVVNGSGTHYAELIDFVEDHDMDISENYDSVATMMDINEFINYYMANIYFQNEDWPHNNIKYWRPHTESGKWRWVLYDTDFGWGYINRSGNCLEWATRIDQSTKLITELLESDTFKNEFIQRLAGHINTTFSPEYVTPIFDSIKGLISQELVRHMDRWDRPELDYMQTQIEEVMPEFTRDRPDVVRNQLKKKFGLTGMYTLLCQVNDPNMGQVRACEVLLPENHSGTYFKEIPLRLVAIPKSGYSFSHWEGSSESDSESIFLTETEDASLTAVFKPAISIANIFINEVCASNKGNISDDYGQLEDWVEIYNDNDYDVNLSGWYLSDSSGNATQYQIPSGYPGLTTIKAKDYLVFWCDNDSEQGPLHTNFKLRKEGELLTLVQKTDQSFHYVDSMTYAPIPSDLTFGLMGVADNHEYMMPTPNAANIPGDERAIFINEYLSKNSCGISDESQEMDDWIEIFNPTSDTLDLGGLYFTDSLGHQLKHKIPEGNLATRIAPHSFKVLWADNQPEQGPLHLGFKLDSKNEQIGVYQIGIGYLDSLSYNQGDGEIVSGRYPDGNNVLRALSPTPGTPNEPLVTENLFINEFMASNSSSLYDVFGESDDWIEIYNDNEFPVDIGGYYLTDSLANPSLHRIPTCKADSTTIPAKGYLILWADNQEEQGVLHLDFKLGAAGEEIGLISPDGSEYIDSLVYSGIVKDQAAGRLTDGSENIQFLSATPGYANEVRQIKNIYINEFMAGNKALNPDGNGEFEDWIEIYNANDYPVDMGGIYVTDSLGSLSKYRIPSSQADSTTILPGGYLVLWADGQTEQGILHLDFKLSTGGEQIGIVQADGKEIIDSLSYDNLSSGLSMGRIPDGGDALDIITTSPGGTNAVRPTGNLYLSEFVASGNESNPDLAGDYDDWIEIYNGNDFQVDIGGFYISDSLAYLTKYQIPADRPDSTTIPPGGFLILWADNQPEQGVDHLDFKLGGKGEQLALVSPNGLSFIDSVSFPDQYKHFSYSRMSNMGDWKFLPPTFGAENSLPEMTGIRINEFSASNTSFEDVNGGLSDWIELYNSNEFPVNIGGLYITDSLGSPTKYRIPSHSPELSTIEANGFYILYADNKEVDEISHVSFKLSRSGEQLGLIHYDQETILDSITYPEQFKNSSFSWTEANGQWISIPPTPGEFNQAPDLSKLVINEIMGSNKTSYCDANSEYDDWIELYNGGVEALDVGGLFMSDSLNYRFLHRISSEYPDSTTIPAGGYKVFWADDTEEQGIMHLGFKISKTGEGIGLYDYSGAVIDSVYYPFISPNLSWSRTLDGEGEWVTCFYSTPLMSNMITRIEENDLSSESLKVYPNPAVDKAYFEIFLEDPCHVKLEIVDENGKLIALIQQSHNGSGSLTIEWDCTNMSGSRPKSGLYFCRIQTKNFVKVSKLILL